MSFADLVREELCELPVKKPCCRRALTAGLLFAASTREHHGVAVRYKSECVSALATEMIAQVYAKTPDVKRSGACGHTYFDLTVTSPALSKLCRQISSEGEPTAQILHFSCDACRMAYLRGVFLAIGTVNDPARSFHLELCSPADIREERLFDFLVEQGYPPRRIKRAGGVGLYYKGGAAIEELLTLMGTQHIIFDVINNRIAREIRNTENRVTNCVTKNIEKTVSAAARQIEAINKLMEHNRLDSLDTGLQITAMVRYRNPDATLDELTVLHDPPISKSGLNHRLKKILELAEKL